MKKETKMYDVGVASKSMVSIQPFMKFGQKFQMLKTAICRHTHTQTDTHTHTTYGPDKVILLQ